MKKKNNIFLEVCKRTHPKYVEFRNRHYVENKGCHGQQIHFLIYYKNQIVGIISGASSVYAVKSRDDFFKIPKDKQLKEKYYLPSIINNVVFRLELHKKNLATQILSKWRKVVVELWENLYNIKVIGFETFVVETDTRKGCLYKADNWSYVGITQGSTKCHKGLTSKSTRKSVSKKLVYCKWIKNIPITPIKKYISCWRMETKTEKDRAKQLSNLKKNLLGVKF